MLYVTHSGGECHPCVRCHVCDRHVDDTGDALVAYPSPVEEGRTVRVVIVHRGACEAQVMESLANEHGPPETLKLDDYLTRIRDARQVAC